MDAFVVIAVKTQQFKTQTRFNIITVAHVAKIHDACDRQISALI